MKKEREKNKLNNNGYTLIELLVVIGIITVLVGGMSIAVSLIFSKDAAKCAASINDQLSNARMLSMSREGVYTMKVNMDPAHEDNYVEISTASGGEYTKIDLGDRVIISFGPDGGTLGTGTVEIVFDKASGAVRSVDGSETIADIYLFHIESVRGTRTSEVELVSGTGRHYIR